MSVRKSPPPPGPGVALTKRARVDDEEDDSRNMTLTVASSGEGQRKNALIRTIQRTSGLEAPIVALGGAHGVSRGRDERQTETDKVGGDYGL
jgi:Prp8 binding protein